MEHQAVEAPEEGGEGFAGTGGRKDQGAFAAGDDRPAHPLGGGRCVEDSAKPFGRDGVKAGEGIRRRAIWTGWFARVLGI